MSMMGTLGKIAMGIMVAKGVSGAMSGSNNLGGLVGSLLGGGKTGSTQQSSGGIGDLLGSLTGNSTNSQQGGGLGGLLNSLSSNTQSSSTSNTQSNDLGSLLSAAFQGNNVEATPDEEKQAEVILRAMISAAKADGNIDAKEQQKITEHIGDITAEEIEFVRNEMQSPLDIEALIETIPGGMEQQVYMMSLLTIDLDSKSEAQYMDKLAQGLHISKEASNAIHQKLGAPLLYNS